MKSFKLELKPLPETKKAMKEHKVMELNRSYIEAEKALHPAIDFVVKKIISDSLATHNEDFRKLYELKLKSEESDTSAKKYMEARDKAENEVKKTIAAYKFPKSSKNYKTIGSAEFLKDVLPELIKNAKSSEISTEDKIAWLELLQGFQGASTLMSKFVTTRITSLETWCPKRVLENFDIFVDNMEKVRPFLNTKYAEEFIADFPELESFIDPSYYELCLTPSGIDEYNRIISGVHSEEGTEIKGYNQLVNELNQKNRAANSGHMSFRILKPLNQQILFPKKSSFSIEKMTSDEDVRNALKLLMETISKKELFNIISLITRTRADEIVVNGSELHNLSHILLGEHSTIPTMITQNLCNQIEDELEIKKSTLKSAEEDKKMRATQLREELKAYKQQHKGEKEAVEQFKATIDAKIKDNNENFKSRKKELNASIKELTESLNKIILMVSSKTFTLQEIEDYSDEDIQEKYIEHLKYLYNEISAQMASITTNSNIMVESTEIRFHEKNKLKVKNYLDSLIAFRSALNIVYRTQEDDRKNVLFYNDLEEKFKIFAPLTKLYNQTRNYLVSKAGEFAETETVFFGTPSKLASRWWSGDRFIGNSESILHMNGKYYYITRGLKQSSIDFLPAEADEPYYELMSQKTSQDASKQIPRCVFSPECQEFFEKNPEEMEYVHTEWLAPLTVTREQYCIYKNKLFTVAAKKSGQVSPAEFEKNLHNMINLYKRFCEVYDHYQRFTFLFQPTETYADMGEFVSEANVYMLNTYWVKLKASQINTLIESGQLYAFLITNQTMYTKSPYKDPYAMLFLNLMSKENMKSGKCRLNAKPGITYRHACIQEKITHPMGSVLVNKRTRSGNHIPSDIYMQIYRYLNGKLKTELSKEAKKLLDSGEVASKVAEKNYIKDKRYTENKFFISMSYVQNNRISERKVNTITEDVNKSISQNGTRTLVVTRGVKNLLYYILFDKDHSIMQEGSLNVINGVDYGKRLKELTVVRNSGKSDDWNYTITSKNVKEFYLHVAIGEICKIAYKNKAIICIEKITAGFKDKMSALDNQLFGKFEIMLENRLRDLKFPRAKKGEIGSVTNPLQLAKTTVGSPMQNGILFKVSPAYTSSICPTTGFVNLFKCNLLQTAKSQKEFLQNFDSITYNADTGLFELTFNYINFQNLSQKPKDKEWKLFAGKDVYFFANNKLISTSGRVEELVQILMENQMITKDLSKEELPAQVRKLLFLLIRDTLLKTVVRLEKDDDENYYCSPAVPDIIRHTQAHVKTLNLAKKFWFILEHMEDGKLQYTTSEEWINHYLD